MKQKKIVVANWKMNPLSLNEAKDIFVNVRSFARLLKNTEVIVCTPVLYLPGLLKLGCPKNMHLGVQNISNKDGGAFTGEIGASMIKNLGVNFSIIGHSERREMGESNEAINQKIKNVIRSKIVPILCVGEKVRDKEATHLDFIKNQIKECLFGLEKKDLLGFILAYEPIWAIGKSYKEVMDSTDIHEMTLFIKKTVGEIFGVDIGNSFKILYGGSVEYGNIRNLCDYSNADGFLVGHMSLNTEEFGLILKEVDKIK